MKEQVSLVGLTYSNTLHVDPRNGRNLSVFLRYLTTYNNWYWKLFIGEELLKDGQDIWQDTLLAFFKQIKKFKKPEDMPISEFAKYFWRILKRKVATYFKNKTSTPGKVRMDKIHLKEFLNIALVEPDNYSQKLLIEEKEKKFSFLQDIIYGLNSPLTEKEKQIIKLHQMYKNGATENAYECSIRNAAKDVALAEAGITRNELTVMVRNVKNKIIRYHDRITQKGQ